MGPTGFCDCQSRAVDDLRCLEVPAATSAGYHALVWPDCAIGVEHGWTARRRSETTGAGS